MFFIAQVVNNFHFRENYSADADFLSYWHLEVNFPSTPLFSQNFTFQAFRSEKLAIGTVSSHDVTFL